MDPVVVKSLRLLAVEHCLLTFTVYAYRALTLPIFCFLFRDLCPYNRTYQRTNA